MQLTITVPTSLYGDLLVTADITPGRYDIGAIRNAEGACCCGLVSADLLEEIETSIEFAYQCARYEEAIANCEDMRAFDLYTV